MNNKYFFILITCVISFSSCKKARLEEQISGKWSLVENPESVIEFDADNKYNFYIGDINVATSLSGKEGWKYFIEKENDSLFIIVTDKTDTLYKGYPRIQNDTLHLTFFENLKTTGNFISKEVGVYVRKSN